jgi:hypothetical protein
MTKELDRSLSAELSAAGLEFAGSRPFMLTDEVARQLGETCRDCGRRRVVYFISIPLADLFPPGGYCYPCLLVRCRAARIIPFPIEVNLLDRLKADLNIPAGSRPRYITR